MKYLVVDDSRIMLRMMHEAMAPLGEVFQAENGMEALAIITADGPFDLILSDWSMPEMDGLTLLQTVRSSGNKTPFIMVSAEEAENVSSQAMSAGAAAYILKPFTLSALQEEVRRVLGLTT